MRRSFLAIIPTLLLAQEVQIQKVTIEDFASNTSLYSDELKFSRQQDLAEILARFIPELNMVRATAIGNDIVLRGFKRDDVNFLIDGAKIYGGCPNRMDPPAMHLSITDVQRLEVKEGPFDVENFGSMGGMVNVVTKEPQQGFGGVLEAMLGSFGYKKFGARLHAGDEKLKMALFVGSEKSGQYEDGHGRTLVEQNWEQLGKNDPYAYQERYKNLDAYTRNSIGIKMRYDIDADQSLKASYYADRATNVLYPAFQMDAQLDKTQMFNGLYTINNIGKFSQKLQIQGYYSHVVHDMGTEFRNAALNSMTYRTHHVKSTIEGMKLKNDLEAFGLPWRVGVEVSKRNWNGICLAEPTKRPKQVRIPDVDTLQKGLFIETSKKWDALTINVGARYDSAEVKAHRFNDPTIKNIAAIQNYYKGLHKRTYDDFSANLMARYRLSDTDNLYLALGQGVRIPDAQELYFIGFMMGNWTRKGNPHLKEAKNREIDIGYDTQIAQVALHTQLFYSKVADYIYAYSTNAGNADPTKKYLTWTNIDAHIYGGSLSAAMPIGDYMMLEGSVAYQRGKKDDAIAGQSDRDMAQIPPLHGRLALSYDDGSNYASLEGLFSAAWKEYDADNGERRIGGWGVVNLQYSKKLNDTISVQFGIDNIFDKAYARNNTYAGRSLIGGRNPVLVYEPGRYIYAGCNVRF